MHQELIKFIEEYLVKGFTRDEIRQTLLKNGGWTNADLDQAFKEVTIVSIPVAEKPIPPIAPKPSIPKAEPIGLKTIQPQASVSSIVIPAVNKQDGDISAPVISGTLLPPMDLFKSAWNIYKSKYQLYFSILAIPAIFSLLVAIFFPDEGVKPEDISAISLAVIFILSGFLMVAQFLSQLALFYSIFKKDEQLSLIEAYKNGAKKTFSYIWIAILSGLIISGGIIFFIVPGLLFSIWFSLALFVLFTDEAKGMNALLTSREYLRGMMWKFLLRSAFIAIVAFVVSLSVYLLLWPLEYLLSLLSIGVLSNIFAAMVTFFVQSVTVPISIIYMFLLLEDIKRLKGNKVEVKSKKWPFILIGVIGSLIIPVMLVIYFYFVGYLLKLNDINIPNEQNILTDEISIENETKEIPTNTDEGVL